MSFTGPNGAHGASGLTLVGSTLYGSTAFGGATDDGVLFSVHTDGTGFTLLHQFNGTDGRQPTGFLRMGAGGILYGVTEQGSPTYPQSNYGVLFSLAPNGTYSVLHVFTNCADGSLPDSLAISSNGVLVGSTYYAGSSVSKACPPACGVVFQYVPKTAKFSVLHSFNGTDGSTPYVGSFGPGPTVYGAANNVFSIGPNGYSIIATFGLYDGGNPVSGPLYVAGGTLVGVNSDGPPAVSGAGTIYAVQKGVITAPWIFGGGESGGGDPEAQPILTSGGSIIGTSTIGDYCAGCGAIWEYKP